MTTSPPQNSSNKPASGGARSLTVLPTPRPAEAPAACVALVGNPNAGKTTLFNRLTGLRAKTANFPGTTVECRRGRMSLRGAPVTVLDLPGLYGFDAGATEEVLAAQAVRGLLPGWPKPTAAVVVVDATRLGRQLYLVSQVLEMGVPTVVALNMIDVAEREHRAPNIEALSKELGVTVVPVSARSGRGMTELLDRLDDLMRPETRPAALPESLTACTGCSGCPFSNRHRWASDVQAKSGGGDEGRMRFRSDRLDRFVAHPVLGLAIFGVIMAGLFVATFWIAAYPMDWIDSGFGWLGAAVSNLMPEGDLRSLIVDGILAGVGGVLVFLPQICILFFLLSLLEDTGYLARAALVTDRLMSRVGLPGKAFVPMLTAHACAIPAIMSTRVIDDKRDRLLAILVLPLMTCSARLPVYAMVVALLFAGHPVWGGLVFAGAYLLGILAVFCMTFVFRRTILPGKPTPLVLELPDYRLPSLRTALLTVYDRGRIFLKKAGTVILLISIGLWALSTYPKPSDPSVTGAEATRVSALGRVGTFVEPVFRPLGFDWQIDVGVMSSFAARETIVSTLSIVYNVGDDAEETPSKLTDALAAATRPDGTPVFTVATCLSLLVFFVLAMQCLPTQAVTKRETGSWKWAAFQLVYMTVLAYGAALVTYQVVSRLT